VIFQKCPSTKKVLSCRSFNRTHIRYAIISWILLYQKQWSQSQKLKDSTAKKNCFTFYYFQP